jgi:hypothetical protein
MLKAFRLPLLALVCALASGCITAVTTIHVKPDGSGTIEQSMAMKAEMAEQLAAMAAGFSDTQDKDKSADKAQVPEIFSEKEMKDAASKYGEGVTFVSSKPIKTSELVGRVATYAFTDISKVRINQKPPSPNEAGGSPKSVEDVSFKFARKPGGTSLVTVVFPEPDFSKKKELGDKEARPKPDPAQLEMAKKLFDGLRIDIGLDVAGTIVKTNSPYVQGSRVTLLEMDFSQLLTNDKLMSQLTEPNSIEEAKQMLAGVKGFKVNLEREVNVEFK